MDKLVKDFRSFHRSTFGQNNMSAVDQMIMGQAGFKNSYMNPYILIEREQFNMTQMDVFSYLMQSRLIFFGTEVTSETANIVVSQLLYLDSVDPDRDITLYVNSPGGSVYDGYSILDTMDYINSKVGTTCTGLAASFGAMILLNGELGMRRALRRARVMLHQPLISGGIKGQASDIEIEAKEILKIKDELYQTIVEHSKMSLDEVIKRADRDCWLTSKEALDLGLIDEVITKVKK